MAKLIQGKTSEWEMVIGLEVHAQATADAKLFSGSATVFGSEQNSQVSFVDAAMPGMLPVVNERSVEQAVRTGLGLKAEINMTSVFERKNYFYPDLPQGYQISQFLHPIVGEGSLEIDLPDGTSKEIGITRLHLEQDAFLAEPWQWILHSVYEVNVGAQYGKQEEVHLIHVLIYTHHIVSHEHIGEKCEGSYKQQQ